MVVVLGDMHIGARKSSPAFHDYFGKSIDNMFDFMEDRGIKHILQVGDMFDVPSHLTTFASNFIKERFLNELVRRKIELLVIIGNHDCYYRDKTSLNTVSEVLVPYNNPKFNIITSPQDVNFGGIDFACFPWICRETQKETEELLKNSKASVAVGHFEFLGFEYHRGTLSTAGHVHTDYGRFDKVISGHYHTHSIRDNVHYTGTPYELTWVDYKDPKGFWVFDGKNMERVKNNKSMFHVWDYPQEFTKDDIHGGIHRIRVDSSSAKTKEFGEYRERMMGFSPIEDIKVLETNEDVVTETAIDSVVPRTQIDYVSSYIKSNGIQDGDAVLKEMSDIFDQLGNYDFV
jgi:DNA repair exonuclease SbcCD nuclease subunit